MKRALALLLLPMLAGCASSTIPWANPSVPKDQWSRDYSGCRRYADRDAGWREEGESGSGASSGSPFRDYDRQQAKKRFDASLSACMIDRGYVPAARTPAARTKE